MERRSEQKNLIKPGSGSGSGSGSGVSGGESVTYKFRGTPAAEELLSRLIAKEKLTDFQKKVIAEGKARQLLLGDYVLLDRLGRGAMGIVLKARHCHMDRIVALKALSIGLVKNPRFVSRFKKEARSMAKLSHPNIVTAYDAGEYLGVYYLVMEYVEGSTLSQLVRKNGPLTVEDAVRYVIETAKGLEYASSKKMVHRDIKPGNIMLTKAGEIKILDFGLARLEMPGEESDRSGKFDRTVVENLSAKSLYVSREVLQNQQGDLNLTQAGEVTGTIDYMAPEQAMNASKVDLRADIYSLGCTFHYLLRARPVYTEGRDVIERLMAHQQCEIPSISKHRSDVPQIIDLIFKRMVAKRAKQRYGSYRELCEDLSNVLRTPTTGSGIQSGQLTTDTATASNSATTITLASESSVSHAEVVGTPEEVSDRERRLLSRNSQSGTSVWYATLLVAVIVLCGYYANTWINPGVTPSNVKINRDDGDEDDDSKKPKEPKLIQAEEQKVEKTDQSSGGFDFSLE